MNLEQLFDLAPHGPDVFVGEGHEYPWGGLFGGHIVAQALRAAAYTVSDELLPHSLRAYFIRRGDNLNQFDMKWIEFVMVRVLRHDAL